MIYLEAAQEFCLQVKLIRTSLSFLRPSRSLSKYDLPGSSSGVLFASEIDKNIIILFASKPLKSKIRNSRISVAINLHTFLSVIYNDCSMLTPFICFEDPWIKRNWLHRDMAAEAILVCGAADILKKLISVVTEEIGLVWSVKDEKEKLQIMSNMILAVIADAEKRQVQGEAVIQWLKRLKDLSDVANSILDEYLLYENAVVHPMNLGMDKVWNSVSLSMSNPLIFRFKMAHRIKDLNRKLDEIAKEKVMFNWPKIRLESLDHSNNMITMSIVADESSEDNLKTHPVAVVDSSKIVETETDLADQIGKTRGDGKGERELPVKNQATAVNIPVIRLYAGTLFCVMLMVLVRQLWVWLRPASSRKTETPVLKPT